MKASLILLLPLVAALLGCSSSSTTAPSTQPGTLRVLLVDDPAVYDAVNIAVTQVSVHAETADSMSGWTVLNSTPRTFDLLTLRNGASQVIGDAPLNPGHYTQIRLKLADSCTVVVDGLTHPLEVPSGTQSGLKLNHPFEIEPNALYELTLDFDAARSIHQTGNGRYMLRPVIRVVPTLISGTLSGMVSPASAKASIFTLAGTDTVGTLADTLTGAFMLVALPAGSYDLHVVPAVATYRDTTLAGVPVVAGQNTDLGTIELRLR